MDRQALEQARLIQAKYDNRPTSHAESSRTDPRANTSTGSASRLGTTQSQDGENRSTMSPAASRTQLKETISKLYAKKDPSSAFGQIPGVKTSDGPLRSESEDPVDVRIEREITKLNEAAAITNKLQAELQELDTKSAVAISELNEELSSLETKLGKCVEEAAPYFEAKLDLKLVDAALQQATFAYARAKARLVFYKEQVSKLEKDLMGQGGTVQLGPLSLLNALNSNVMECQSGVRQKQQEHSDVTNRHRVLTERVKHLEKTLKSAIKDSRPYYKLKDQLTYVQNEDALRAETLKATIGNAKEQYAKATETLRTISKEIHESRHEHDGTSDESATDSEDTAGTVRSKKSPSEKTIRDD